MNKWVREINIRMGESPCEPVKGILYVIGTDKVISEAESKYKEHEPLFNNYKQLNNETSLEWFCNPELIKSYEYWDCKNLDKYKPSKAEQEKIKIAGKWMKQNKSLIDQKRKEFETLEKLGYLKNANLYAKTIPEIGKLAGIDFDKACLGSARRAQLQLDHKSARHITQQYQPLIEKLRNAQLPNSYISTAETAFKALGGRSSLRDMIDSIQPYQSEVDHILSRGVDAQIARAMYGTHSELLEQFRNLKPPKPKKKDKKYWKKKAKEIGEAKAKELEEKDKAHAKALEELETLKKIIGHYLVEQSISDSNEKEILKKRNKELEPITELSEPTAEENECFSDLKDKAQNQVNLIFTVINDLGYLSVGNGERGEIHKECHKRDPHLITGSYDTFKAHAWRNARKSGRTPK